jgi:alpha-beta hydrolase superfamily lysophospholipase
MKKVILWAIVAIAAAVFALHRWAAPAAPDDFYNYVYTGQLAARGKLLRAEPFARGVPDNAVGWRILYGTARADGTVVPASAVVLVPVAGTPGPRDIIAWAHGTTGIVAGCAPSLFERPFHGMPALPQVVAAGWAVVAPDYAGLGTPGGHAYLVGEEAANAVADGLKAARQIEGANLSTRYLTWGHSQGGNTALWMGMRGSALAPELSQLGVAALAPASDLKGLVREARTSAFGKIVSAYVLKAYGAAYPDIDAAGYRKPWTKWLLEDIASRCVGDLRSLFSVAETFLLPDDVFARDPLQGAMGERLAQNSPPGPFAVPVLLAQGKTDDLVLPAVQDGYVKARCAEGMVMDYREIDDRDHMSLVLQEKPLTELLMQWSKDRFDGKSAAAAC